jgi:hypothetical protein
MALNASPRKVVPLATGDESRPKPDYSGSQTTTRVFFCGVVVEGSESGRRLPEGEPIICTLVRETHHDVPCTEIEELVLSLGDVLGSEAENRLLSSSAEQVSADSVSKMLPECPMIALPQE